MTPEQWIERSDLIDQKIEGRLSPEMAMRLYALEAMAQAAGVLLCKLCGQPVETFPICIWCADAEESQG